MNCKEFIHLPYISAAQCHNVTHLEWKQQNKIFSWKIEEKYCEENGENWYCLQQVRAVYLKYTLVRHVWFLCPLLSSSFCFSTDSNSIDVIYRTMCIIHSTFHSFNNNFIHTYIHPSIDYKMIFLYVREEGINAGTMPRCLSFCGELFVCVFLFYPVRNKAHMFIHSFGLCGWRADCDTVDDVVDHDITLYVRPISYAIYALISCETNKINSFKNDGLFNNGFELVPLILITLLYFYIIWDFI